MGKYISCNDNLVHLKCVHRWQVPQEINFWLHLEGLAQLIQEDLICILKAYTITLKKIKKKKNKLKWQTYKMKKININQTHN